MEELGIPTMFQSNEPGAKDVRDVSHLLCSTSKLKHCTQKQQRVIHVLENILGSEEKEEL